MADSIMVCNTAWVDPPELVVFMGRESWGGYVQQRYGHIKRMGSICTCSECRRLVQDGSEYCSHCGVRLDGRST